MDYRCAARAVVTATQETAGIRGQATDQAMARVMALLKGTARRRAMAHRANQTDLAGWMPVAGRLDQMAGRPVLVARVRNATQGRRTVSARLMAAVQAAASAGRPGTTDLMATSGAAADSPARAMLRIPATGLLRAGPGLAPTASRVATVTPQVKSVQVTDLAQGSVPMTSAAAMVRATSTILQMAAFRRPDMGGRRVTASMFRTQCQMAMTRRQAMRGVVATGRRINMGL